MRLVYTLGNDKIGKEEFVRSFKFELGSLFNMNWELSDSESRLKMALFVLNPPHILDKFFSFVHLLEFYFVLGLVFDLCLLDAK